MVIPEKEIPGDILATEFVRHSSGCPLGFKRTTLSEGVRLYSDVSAFLVGGRLASLRETVSGLVLHRRTQGPFTTPRDKSRLSLSSSVHK